MLVHIPIEESRMDREENQFEEGMKQKTFKTLKYFQILTKMVLMAAGIALAVREFKKPESERYKITFIIKMIFAFLFIFLVKPIFISFLNCIIYSKNFWFRGAFLLEEQNVLSL